MSKKKFKIRLIHAQAVAVLVIYAVFSKAVFIKSVASQKLSISFFGPFLFCAISGLILLYLFSHGSFFPVAKEIEKEEKGKGEKWRERLSHHSKIFICLVMGGVGGPILGALTVRLLIHKHSFWYKYLILIIAEALSTAFYVCLAKGFIRIFLW